jgi:DNA replication licensing factor MCM7
MIQLQKVANRQSNIIEIELDDLKEFFATIRDMRFVERVRINTSRYIGLFSSVIDTAMPMPTVQAREEDQTTFDIVMQQRRYNAMNAQQAMIAQGLIKAGEVATGQGLSKMGIPPELERNYHLSIVPGGNSAKKTFVKMRDIKASSVGSLVSVKGIVTRVSDVKPCM